MRPFMPSTALCAILFLSQRHAVAIDSVKIATEASDDYTGCPGPSMNHNGANVDGFYNGMTTTAGVAWTKVVPQFYNFTVYDTDFVDSGRGVVGADQYNFDRPNLGITMYSGHGGVNQEGGTCTASAQCTTPNTAVGQSLPGVCTRPPAASTGTCFYNNSHILTSCSPGSDTYGGNVPYLDGYSLFGEDAASGVWGGGGSNGGANFAILDISFGASPGLIGTQWWEIFGGVHDIATIMPTATNSDTADIANRGSAFASRFTANPNSSIGNSWISVACDLPNGGINGFGAYIVISVEESSTWASWANLTESWRDVRIESNDARAAGAMTWAYVCNYDCHTYPVTI